MEKYSIVDQGEKKLACIRIETGELKDTIFRIGELSIKEGEGEEEATLSFTVDIVESTVVDNSTDLTPWNTIFGDIVYAVLEESIDKYPLEELLASEN